VKEILEANTPTEIMAQASEIGLEASLQGEPTGLGYMVWKIAQFIGNLPTQMLDARLKDQAGTRRARLILGWLRRASTLGPIIAGSKFARTGGHFVNRSLSYVPGVGLARWFEGSMTPAKFDIVLMRQLMGLATLGGVWGLLMGKDDDEEGIEGSWKGLDANQRAQLLQQGKQPNTVWYRDEKGRIRSYNYLQWGLANILNTLGSMEDQRRYHGNTDATSVILNGIATGSLALSEKTQMQGLFQTLFMDSARDGADPKDKMAKKLNRWASNTVGGIVPRIFKDVDAVISPALMDTSEGGWVLWAQHMPMVRQLSSGKRIGILGNDVTVDRGPLSRVTGLGTADPAFRTLGKMNERDLWLPDPSAGQRVVKLAGGERREMTAQEKDRYQRKVAEGYKTFVMERGAEVLAMEDEAAKKYISRHTESIRNRAAYQAVRR
jgi:hypothetical protein